MKKLVVVGMMVSLFVTQLAAPRRAEAIVSIAAIASGVIPVMVLGGLGVAAGGSLTLITIHDIRKACHKRHGFLENLNCAFTELFEGGLLVAGILLLDGQPMQDLSFASITSEGAEKIGLSQAEAESFNANLPEINVIRETIETDVAAELRAGVEAAKIDVREKWENYRDTLSPESYSALEKVSGYLANKIRLAQASRAR